jgi:hypothetical protein
MIVSKPLQRRKKRRSRFSLLFTVALSTAMIVTGGFGTFPNNPLVQMFQQVVGENVPADFLHPFNSYLDSLSVPTIQPQPASTSEAESLLDPLSAIEELLSVDTPAETSLPAEQSIIGTSVASINGTQTQLVAVTASALASTSTLAPLSTQTATSLPTSTVPPLPTSTIPTISIIPPFIRQPASTKTPIPTITPTPFLGFSFNTVNLNASGSSIVVGPNSPVNVTYNFNIWDDPCPGCISQLVTGLGTSGTQGSTCAFDGDAGLFPGASGSENITLTAPGTVGTYPVSVEYGWQYTCADALSVYGNGGSILQTIGQVQVSCTNTGPAVISGENWYLGNTYCSCTDVCAAHGGINTTAFDKVGNDPTGSNLYCDTVFDALLGPGTAVDWADIGNGLGCMYDIAGFRSRYVGPIDPATSSGNVQRVCACTN